ncbi:uncharacterized protein LOC128679961 isoform X2 [Plodia interpunctella]|uniref:uncharacterized protein LOC128679961 isoform X2 n=1 Tax=Plodia interpunctella TaxID=58824 RepID=UPI00236840EF|nr:uncharacterized protein LOC128679961 isoform X2 [Plodia interpunctella]
MSKIIRLLFYITPALCQYAVNTEMRADVTFGENNDRFDISNIIQEQRRFEEYLAKNLRDTYKEDKQNGEISSEESRRSFKYPDNMLARRWDGGFAFHDNMDGDLGGSLDDYEKGLDIFKKKNGRRSLNLFRYLGKPLNKPFHHGHRRNHSKEGLEDLTSNPKPLNV